ncbi:MAG: carbamoyltransferase HypF [Polyangiaceae bacterium]
MLAFGAYLKNTLCLCRGQEAYLSQHLGDLDNAATVGFLEESAAHLLHVLEVEPAIVAHDRHPDFPSTRLAAAWAAARGIPALAVGHHHAHIAAVLAESGYAAAVIGLALDGIGLGDDGGLWGGELLRVAGADCRRLGGLAPLALPGGDKAAREPWRLAAAALHALGRNGDIPAFIARRYPEQPGAAMIAEMLGKHLNCPPTSSLGRLFDAAAGLLGLRPVQRFEAQAAMELEGLAQAWEGEHGPAAPLAAGWRIDRDGHLDFRPLLAWLADCDDAPLGAARCHATLAAGLAQWAADAAQQANLDTVALGGAACSTTFSPGICGAICKPAASPCWKPAWPRPTTAASPWARPGWRGSTWPGTGSGRRHHERPPQGISALSGRHSHHRRRPSPGPQPGGGTAGSGGRQRRGHHPPLFRVRAGPGPP